MRSRKTVVSIGYERRSPTELVAMLLEHGVTKLLDVRELPLSRRKGFSKTPLSTLLETRGITYRHIRDAGNPHRAERARPAHCLSLYRQYLRAHPQIPGLVAAELNGAPVAVLCYERDHSMCHRSILIEALAASVADLRVVRVE